MLAVLAKSAAHIVRSTQAVFLCRMEDKPILCTGRELRLVQHLLYQLANRPSKEVNPEILEILLSNPEFTRLHLSLYYPFTVDDLERYGDRLIWGSIRYSTFVWDIKQQHIEFAEIGLSFNENFFVLCSQTEFVYRSQTRLKKNPFPILKMWLPLDLDGELHDRYSTTLMAQYIQRPFMKNYKPEKEAEEIRTAFDLYSYQEEVTTIKTMKDLIEKHGVLAAYCKSLWDELLIGYVNGEIVSEIMGKLNLTQV
jgi:hypothetical protein